MTENKKELSGVYQKHHSFENFNGKKDGMVENQVKRAVSFLTALLDNPDSYPHPARLPILKKVHSDLKTDTEKTEFIITQFIAEEMNLLEDEQLDSFLYHRYRYDVFPKNNELDRFPPYLQIEPTSMCNYRCVFCYQTDNHFTNKKNGYMGNMSLDTYKRIVDQIEGEVEFLSLASRGEPTICKDFVPMLEYSRNKFLNLKVNTNASLLNETIIHALLSGGVKTLVFSADAAKEPLYSKLRVNGKLDKVLKNVELFFKIRETQYPDAKIITRVSGVKFDENQSIEAMNEIWGPLVDQIAFVKYNPWENIYETEPNGVLSPCSDLWRRMFVWFDGSVNPCDSDYRSTLKMGSILDSKIDELWNSDSYNSLRKAHLSKARQQVEPCRRCSVV